MNKGIEFEERVLDYIEKKFNKEDYLYILKKIFYLLKIKNNSINKYTSQLILNMIKNNSKYFIDSPENKEKKDETSVQRTPI